ncbi:putative membrane protein [Tahibacter aquaticus]|uniref:Putative membrane protein n=1 Tax=Tahibacter aquaticus TaxID=520092 RepID=A0A4R6YT53_9GAMM|nr:DUF1003 domain-containing protein [Tahibacter aquaticus]TDR41567.1 putative membrane protein [Tahibacter aquaticus]
MSSTHPHYLDSATRWFGRRFADLDHSTRRALTHAADRRAIATAPATQQEAAASFGERMADRVARFGGSWAFIGMFGLFLVCWSFLNTQLPRALAFDPYPYIFLNLILSMLAALQAPVIMMSQNRQAAKDRQMAVYDYEVNVKAEVEIMALHDKLDALRSDHLVVLLQQQQAQIDLLTRLIAAQPPVTAAAQH